MAELDLALLGPPTVTRDGAPVGFDTRKATAVLALLAMHDHELSRERLAALLWPEADATRARASLRRTLSVTAAAAGPALRVTRAAVALEPGRFWVDVSDFETLAARPDAGALDRAARLYRDDFLAGFALRDCPEFDDWQAATADRLRQRLAAVLERLVTACSTAGDLERGVAHAQRWQALDPLHEPAYQALIRLLAWTGQRSAALRQYRALVRILDTELAVRPLPETTQLYDDVRAGRLAPAPARTAPPARSPEPAGLSPHRARPAGRWSAGRRSCRRCTPRWRGVGAAGRVVTVLGAAGCGKTRLLEEFRSEAQAAGAVVLAGRCHDGESELPFVVAADLLRTALSVCPELPARLPAHTAAMTGRLCPELAVDYPDDPAPLDSPMALARLYGAIGEALRTATTPGLTGPPAGVIVVEDAHWADGPSLDLLAYLARRLAGWPLLLVISWSTEHADRLRGLRAALSEAADAGRATVVEPAPLREEQVRDLLLRSGVQDADVGRLLAQTRGLPMLVREYVEGLRSAAGDGGSERWWPPASVRELLRRRLQAASEPTLQMLSTAAVLGSGCDADLLRAVSGRGEAETVEALDEAVRRFLLTEEPPAGDRGVPTYEFPYEALREVVYDSSTLARRRLLHGRAAGALIRRYERDPVTTRAAPIAEHLQRAGRDSEAAGWWWRAAGRARDLYAHAEEYAYLRRAEALGFPPVQVAVALGDVLTVLGRYREALAEFEAAASAVEAPQGGSAGIEHKLAEVHHRLGDWALAEAHLEVALDLLGPGDASRRARIEADRAVLAYRRGAAQDAASLAEGALAAGPPGPGPGRRGPGAERAGHAGRPAGGGRPGRGPAAGKPGAGARPARPGGGGGRAQQPEPAAGRQRPAGRGPAAGPGGADAGP